MTPQIQLPRLLTITRFPAKRVMPLYEHVSEFSEMAE